MIWGENPTIFGNTHIHPMNIDMEPKNEALEDFCSSSTDSFSSSRRYMFGGVGRGETTTLKGFQEKQKMMMNSMSWVVEYICW